MLLPDEVLKPHPLITDRFIRFPAVLVDFQIDLDVSNRALVLILHLMRYGLHPFPAKETLAERMGVTARTIQEITAELRGKLHKGQPYLIREFEEANRRWLWDFDGLFDAALALEQEARGVKKSSPLKDRGGEEKFSPGEKKSSPPPEKKSSPLELDSSFEVDLVEVDQKSPSLTLPTAASRPARSDRQTPHTSEDIPDPQNPALAWARTLAVESLAAIGHLTPTGHHVAQAMTIFWRCHTDGGWEVEDIVRLVPMFLTQKQTQGDPVRSLRIFDWRGRHTSHPVGQMLVEERGARAADEAQAARDLTRRRDDPPTPDPFLAGLLAAMPEEVQQRWAERRAARAQGDTPTPQRPAVSRRVRKRMSVEELAARLTDADQTIL